MSNSVTRLMLRSFRIGDRDANAGTKLASIAIGMLGVLIVNECLATTKPRKPSMRMLKTSSCFFVDTTY